MGVREFIGGAELGLRAKGLKMDREKQAMLEKMYNEQIASMQANRQQGEVQSGAWEQAASKFQEMTAPRERMISPHEPAFGTETVTPKVDLNQILTGIGPEMLRAGHGVTLMQMMGQKSLEDQITLEEAKQGLKKPGMSEPELTARALKGDPDARAILTDMEARKARVAEQTGAAQAKGRMQGADIDALATAILEGRENIENVRNTFGVPTQIIVQSRVLKMDPKFNFNEPRLNIAALRSSSTMQQRNRGMMGSFVKNIVKQVDRVDEIMTDLASRIGVRALDLPRRELIRKFVGSGQENIIQAYMKEIGAEIAKLSQGSAASIAQLPESNRQEWEAIHDPNLSIRELKTVLDETKHMAEMRLESVDEEIEYTKGLIRANPQGSRPEATGSKRDRAIEELNRRGKVVNEITIKRAMDLLGE